MKVRFTPSGRSQFLRILDYIRQDRPSAAINFRNRAEKALRRLEKFSNSGRAIPEFPDVPFREVIVSPYLLFYKLEKNIVWIVGTWHNAQLPKRPNLGND